MFTSSVLRRDVAFCFLRFDHELLCFFLTYKARLQTPIMQSPIAINFNDAHKTNPRWMKSGRSRILFATIDLCITLPGAVQQQSRLLGSYALTDCALFLPQFLPRSPARFRSRSEATTAELPHSLTSHIRILPGTRRMPSGKGPDSRDPLLAVRGSGT